MLSLQEQSGAYQADFLRHEREWMSHGPPWFVPVRQAAIARFDELGFPTTRDEDWRFTNVAPIANTPFRLSDLDPVRIEPQRTAHLALTDERGCRLTFVNGRYAPELSQVGRLPAGVKICSMAKAFETAPDLTRVHLARQANYRTSAFAALNTAFLRDGAFVHIPEGQVVEDPIHLLFVSGAADESVASHPRTLVLVGARAQATVIESYVGLNQQAYLTNAVTELMLGENAVLEHCRLQQESKQAYHVGGVYVLQNRDSHLVSHAVNLGGALVRNNLEVVLDGPGCESTLNGLFIAGGHQHVDNHLRVEHAKDHCNSREYYKGILSGHARGVFTGRIVVRPGAQKTDAKQTNMNLLLSEDAQMNSRPQLEIFADDVKCTHGATIGQLSKEAIFYLRARGIDLETARNMLIRAFAGEIVERIKVDAVRAWLEEQLAVALPQGHHQPLQEAP